MENSNAWRPLIAVLAHPETRRVVAELMLGTTLETATEGLSPSRRRRATEAIVRSGIISADTGDYCPDVFRAVLDSATTPTRQGIERFVEGTRIRQYPANLGERGMLLQWVSDSVFSEKEVLTEREVNSRLRPYTEDIAVLRRYLVDYRLVERRSDGTEYAATGIQPSVPVD